MSADMENHRWEQFLTAIRREIPSWETAATDARREIARVPGLRAEIASRTTTIARLSILVSLRCEEIARLTAALAAARETVEVLASSAEVAKAARRELGAALSAAQAEVERLRVYHSDDEPSWRHRAEALQAEVERHKAGAYETACLRTGHVATEAAGEIAGLEAEVERLRSLVLEWSDAVDRVCPNDHRPSVAKERIARLVSQANEAARLLGALDAATKRAEEAEHTFRCIEEDERFRALEHRALAAEKSLAEGLDLYRTCGERIRDAEKKAEDAERSAGNWRHLHEEQLAAAVKLEARLSLAEELANALVDTRRYKWGAGRRADRALKAWKGEV